MTSFIKTQCSIFNTPSKHPYLGALLYIMKATIENIILGNQAARKGFNSPLVEKTVENLSITTKLAAITIPKARLSPLPPRVLRAETATPITVRISTENGVALRL